YEPHQQSWDEWAQPTTRRSRPFARRTSRPRRRAKAFARFSWREMVDFHAPNCQAAGRELASIREDSLRFAKNAKHWALAPMLLYALSSEEAESPACEVVERRFSAASSRKVGEGFSP